MAQEYRIENKRKGTVLEVTCKDGRKLVDRRNVYPGQVLGVEVTQYQALVVKEVNTRTGRTVATRTVARATQKPPKRRKPAAKKAARKKPARKKPGQGSLFKNPAKKARKKPAAKRKPAKKSSTAKKRKPASKGKSGKKRTYTCNLCGAKTKSLTKHWWSKHRDYAMSNLRKAKRARKGA